MSVSLTWFANSLNGFQSRTSRLVDRNGSETTVTCLARFAHPTSPRKLLLFSQEPTHRRLGFRKEETSKTKSSTFLSDT